MAIDGTVIKAADFWDEETKQIVSINLSVRDIVFFRLLQKIEGAIMKHG